MAPEAPTVASFGLSQSAPAEPATPPVFLPKRGLCVGRGAEVAQVCAAVLAKEPEPVVVLGPPGIGKSKVTIAALHDPEVKERYRERRWFVRLETAPEPAAIMGQAALAIGVRPGPDLDARVLSALAAGPGLLVLDNTETPWEADPDPLATEQALASLAEGPGTRLVASLHGSEAPGTVDWREPLRVQPLPPEPSRDLFVAIAGERYRHDLEGSPSEHVLQPWPNSVAILHMT